jgi:hypothetical protein
MITQWEECGGRTLLGDNKDGAAVILGPNTFQCVGSLDFKSTSFYIRMNLTIFVLSSDLRKILLAPYLPESYYCLSRNGCTPFFSVPVCKTAAALMTWKSASLLDVCKAFQYIFDTKNARLRIRMSWDSFLVWFTVLRNLYIRKSGWLYVCVCKNSKTAVEAWQNLCCFCYICETTLPPNYLPCVAPSLSFNVLWVAVWRSQLHVYLMHASVNFHYNTFKAPLWKTMQCIYKCCEMLTAPVRLGLHIAPKLRSLYKQARGPCDLTHVGCPVRPDF